MNKDAEQTAVMCVSLVCVYAVRCLVRMGTSKALTHALTFHPTRPTPPTPHFVRTRRPVPLSLLSCVLCSVVLDGVA